MPLVGEVQPRPGFRRAESGIEARFADYLGFSVYRPGENSAAAAESWGQRNPGVTH